MAGKRYDFMDSSSDDSISASFFIKKDPSQPEKEDDDDEVNLSIESMKKIKEASKMNKLKASSAKNSFFSDLGTTKPMDALSRFQQLENQIKARSQNHAKLLQSLSDLDISSDDDIKKDLAELKQVRSSSPEKVPSKDSISTDDREDDWVTSATSSITNAAEFLKPSNVTGQMPSPIESKDPPKLTSVMKKKPSDSKITKSVSFDLGDSKYDDDDDDDLSLDNFMQDQASSISEDVSSLEEIIDSKLQNVLSFDDLLPAAVLGTSDVESSSKEFEKNYRTIDQLVGPAVGEKSQTLSSRTSISSIVTTGTGSVGSGSSRSRRSSTSGQGLSNVRTMDELDTSAAPTSSSVSSKRRKNKKAKSKKGKIEKKKPVVTSVFKASSTSDITSDVTSVQEVNDEYSVDFEPSVVSRSDTLKDTESITSEIQEEYSNEDKSITESVITTYHSDVDDDVSTYTETSSSNFDTYTQPTSTSFQTSTSTDYSRSIKSSRKSSLASKKKKKRGNTAAVQTDPIKITKDFPQIPAELFTFYQPSSLISHQSLAVLTSYSPAVLALQDVLKQQIQLTREFVHRSNSLYEYAQRTLTANYHYTSLADAKELINEQRRKLNLAVYA